MLISRMYKIIRNNNHSILHNDTCEYLSDTYYSEDIPDALYVCVCVCNSTLVTS